MKEINCLVVDDEKSAREGLSSLLSKQEGIGEIGVCKNGLEAIDYFRSNTIDLLFLDIQMPGINGFEVLNSIEESRRPATIFVTAYDQFALQAFDYHAIDYLLKPFTESRFLEALQNVRKLLFTESISLSLQINEVLNSYIQSIRTKEASLVNLSEPFNRLVIRSSGKIHLEEITEIAWIEGYDYYLKVHMTNGMSHLVKDSLKKMISRLPDHFMRIHKSTIINLNKLKRLEHLSNAEYLVVLVNGEKLKVSRTYKQDMDNFLNQRTIS